MSTKLPLFTERLLWPQQALEELARSTQKGALLRRGLLLRRAKDFKAAEAVLIAALRHANSTNQVAAVYEQLIHLHISQGRHKTAIELLEKCGSLQLTNKAQQRAFELIERQITPAPEKREGASHGLVAEIDSEECLITKLQRIQELLLLGDREIAQQLANSWPSELSSPEALELRARLLKALDQPDAAIQVLNELLSGSQGTAAAWQMVLELNYLGSRSNGLALATASRLHPRDPGIATHRTLIELADRRPGQGRRSAFRERLLYSVGKVCPSRHQSDGNLLFAYDHTGRSDLVPLLHASLLARMPETPPLHTNVISQLASTASPHYGPAAERHARCFPARELQCRPPLQGRSLRVGLISPDFYYHPVGRFVQMLLLHGFGRAGALHLVNTGRPAMPRLQALASNRYHELAGLSREQQLQQIRSLQLDVAMDLTGWTGDNNGWLFASGLAPLQINYLGYYASSGLPAIDAWLGDASLFPEPMQEWHSERIVRLPRPFLAWQPDSALPEGQVAVPAAPQGPITFGCFNHVRKLSAPTLRLWARLLQAVPKARLALKAFTTDDPAVVALLQKRMRRCGLDPEAVIWLPSAPRPVDHLRQYGLIDIALDPFPNGGCTTTCEALWMGVPVITLSGSHYVSRMATAVLAGANLPEWIAHNQEEYLRIGQRAAEQLKAIRAGRQQLRAHLQASPLGDAADLASQLWQCLEQLAQNAQAKE